MNISPPNEFLPVSVEKMGTPEEQIKELEKAIRELSNQLQTILTWQRDVYRFLQYPSFAKLRIHPRADSVTEGDWLIVISGTDISFQRLESGSWDEKGAFTA